MKPLFPLLVLVLLTGCGRPSAVGIYRTVGSEDKFLMILEIRDRGLAKLTTRSNLGRADLDQAVQATMSFDNAKWIMEGETIVVTSMSNEGKPMVYRFERQSNGELRWDKNGARFVKSM